MNKLSRKSENLVIIAFLFFLLPFGLLYIPKSNFENSKEYTDGKIPLDYPKNSNPYDPDFNGATKDITYGSQYDPSTFDYTNIQTDDGLVDDTMFSPGWGDPVLRNYADYGVSWCEEACVWGTSDAGVGTWSEAYRYNDDKTLYAYALGDRPVAMQWGAYANLLSPDAHQYISQIRLNYEITVTFSSTQATNLYLHALYNEGWFITSKNVATLPVNEQKYTGTWTISSGYLLDAVRAGDYIKYIGVSVNSNEPWLGGTMISVDYVDIWYVFEKPDLDFFYELDFSGYGLTSVTKFQLEFEVTETVNCTNVHLYDYVAASWDNVLSFDTAGVYFKNVSIDAERYFSGSKHLRVRFERYDYYNWISYTNYHLKVDYLKINIHTPDPPPNLALVQDILQVKLNWDPPNSYGVPITHFNIYRGTLSGGSKTLLDTTSSTAYNDTTGTVGVVYYYVVSAVSAAGEGANSTEVFGKSFDQPFVQWTSPVEHAFVEFPPGEPVTFHFGYDWGEIDDVELIIEKGVFSVNHGSVWGQDSIDIYEATYLDGNITCTLNGYREGTLVTSDVRELYFVKIQLEVCENLNSSTEILGKQLYLILHDPHGDNSYSYFSESTQLSMGVGMQITSSVGVSVGVGASFYLFGIGGGASSSLSLMETTEEGFDFRWEVTDTTSLTSSQVTDDPDYIGPGYGDRYWGESWILKWELNATYREYSNGTNRYQDPQYFYGILRDVDTFCSHEHAPEDWRIQNAVYNSSLPVTWLGVKEESGGSAPHHYEKEVTSTFTRTRSVTIDVGERFSAEFSGVESSITFDLSQRSYVESGESSTYKVGYWLSDDDPTDRIVHGVGIDRTYGTYIFNSSSFFCETSNPFEHNTYDYLPPQIAFPEIDLDSDSDGNSPTPNDSPIVTVEILEEDEIQLAVVKYSIDNGTLWKVVNLTELPGDPGTWVASIPSQPVDTTVLWYIQAWDKNGHNATRLDSYLNPFEYTVIALPEPPKPKIPGFPVIIVLLTMIISTTAITIITSQRRLKKIR